MLEKTLESPLDCKEIQPVHPKGDQSWVFIGRTDVEAETPVLWPPDVKSWLTGKGPHAGKDWGQEEKGMTENEKVGWHHWLNRHEFGWTPGVGDGQGGLVCGSSWCRKVSDKTEQLNWTEQDSLVAQMVKNLPAMQECGFYPLVRKIPWRREWLPTALFLPEEFHLWRSLSTAYRPWIAKSCK